MFSKTFSTIVVALSLFLSENAAVPDNKVMYYDIRNLSLEPPYIGKSYLNNQ